MRYSKFVHHVQNYRHRTDVIVCWLPNSTALTSLHCFIRSRVEVILLMCAVSMLVGAPRNCSRFVCRYCFHEDVLDSFYVPILLYCCTRIQNFALVIILSDSGERMHRDKIPPQRMRAAYRIVTQGSCCAKRFAEFNANCESYCSLEQLVASLSAADEGKSAAGTYHPKTECYYTSEDPCTNHPVCCIVGGAHLD